jgi:putative cell wall-binding protein
MIQDITKIREELEGFTEIHYPYEFSSTDHIKYITLKGDKESFYPGGTYVSIGPNCITVKNSYKQWSLPLCKYTKEGHVQHKTRLFIRDKTPSVDEKDVKKDDEKDNQKDTIAFQQHIIEQMTHQLQTYQQQNEQLIECKQTYEELLQKNRYHVKQLSMDNKEKEEQLKKYKQVIQSAIDSRHTR